MRIDVWVDLPRVPVVTVERWDPTRSGAELNEATVARLLAAASRSEGPGAGVEGVLDAEAAAALAGVARHDPGAGIDWAAAAGTLEDAQLVALIRLFTRGEAVWSGWKSGDASPVIPLARELRARGSYPTDLTAWIRAHSDNRFLPYGNLMALL